jgi:tetratricopeptide (TPR) repeat protein
MPRFDETSDDREPSLWRLLGMPDASPRDATILCGAGISYPWPSGLPTVASFVTQAVEHCTGDDVVREGVMGILHAARPPMPRFEVLVEEISQLGVSPAAIGALFDSRSPNAIHYLLARQFKAGAAIVTTNFDNCLERAAHGPCERVIFRGIDLPRRGPISTVIVKPHGSNPLDADDDASDLVVSVRALARTDQGFRLFPIWREYLVSLLRNRLVVVVGYSGSDDFDITPVLLEARPRLLVWIDFAPGRAPEAADMMSAAESVRRFCSQLPSRYLRGDISQVAGRMDHRGADDDALGVGATTAAQAPTAPGATERWLRKTFATGASKQALLTVLLRHYSLHEMTIAVTETPLSAEAILQRGAAFYYRGDYARACHALDLVDGFMPTKAQQCQVSYHLSAAAFYGGNMERARRESRKNIALAEELRDIGALQTALTHAGAVAFSMGDAEEARALYERVLAYQDTHPSLYPATLATWGLADLANIAGRAEEAIKGYTIAREMARRLGSGQGVAWMSANLGEMFVRAGELYRAAGDLNEAEQEFGRLGIAAGTLYTRTTQAVLAYRRGASTAAGELLRRCVPLLAAHLESPAITTIVTLAYLVAYDTQDPLLLAEISQSLSYAVREGAAQARTGDAAARWNVSLAVIDAGEMDDAVDPELYEACRTILGLTVTAIAPREPGGEPSESDE